MGSGAAWRHACHLLVVHGERSGPDNEAALDRFRAIPGSVLLITRDTGKRGLDLPEADFAIFYSPKSRDDVTWQDVSRIRSTIGNPKSTYIPFYNKTGEAVEVAAMLEVLAATGRSADVATIPAAELNSGAAG